MDFLQRQKEPGPEYRRREDRRADGIIERARPELARELSFRMTHQGSDYPSETPGGHRRLRDDTVDRLGTLIQGLFYFEELSGGDLGEYGGRGLVEVAFGTETRLSPVYVRAEMECFPPGRSYRDPHADPAPALHFELYYDRENGSWRGEEGALLEVSSRIWRKEPGWEPDRSFP